MLALLRVVLGFALFSVLAKATRLAGSNPATDGITDAGYLVIAVALGLGNAVVWAPWIGRLLADPLTGAFTTGQPGDARNDLLQFAHRLALRRWRRLAVCAAFLEGVRHPDLPGGFVLGLGQARPGSWLERVFAREVWKFENAENCLRAWRILRAAGNAPGLHHRAEVNLLIHSQLREAPADPAVLAVPAAPPAPPPRRNERIELFPGAAASGPKLEAEAESPEGGRGAVGGGHSGSVPSNGE